MRIPGKIRQLVVKPEDVSCPAGVYALTEEGRVFVAYDDVPPEQYVWAEVNLTLEDV